MINKLLVKSTPTPALTEKPPLGMDAGPLVEDISRHFNYTLGRDKSCKSAHYSYTALALAVRDRLMERWKNTAYAYEEGDTKRAYYLSLEFLMGRTFGNAMLNLGLENPLHEALHNLGLDLEELVESEPDAGLGNGGLGRLAACFIDRGLAISITLSPLANQAAGTSLPMMVSTG